MSWSYSGDPNLSAKDAVRFYTSDTDIEDQLMQDEEISFLLSQCPNPYQAASKALEIMISKLLRQADTTIGELQVQYTQRATQLQAIVASMNASTSYPITLTVGTGGGTNQLGDAKVLFRKGLMDNG